MLKQEINHNDKRLKLLKEFTLNLISGNFKQHLSPSNKHDDIDALMNGLNMLSEEIEENYINEKTAHKKIEKTIDTLIEFSHLNFSKRIKISNEGSLLDGLASGINMLGEHLELADKEIKENRDELSNILNNIYEIIYSLKIDNNNIQDSPIQFISPQVEAILGYSVSEITNKPSLWFDSIHPEDSNQFYTIINDYLQNKSAIYQSEYRVKHKNGSWKHILSRGKIIEWNTKGEPVIFAGTHTDITKEKEFKEEIDRYEKHFSISMDLLCIANPDGYFLKVNPQFTHILGFSQEELLSKPFFDFIHSDDIEQTVNEVKKLEKGIPTIEFSNRYRCKNGDYKWLIWNASLDASSKLIYASARDITENKKAEESLKVSEERNRTMLSAIPDVIFKITNKGDYIDLQANPENLILPPESFKNRNIKDILPPKQAKKCLQLIKKAIKTNEVQIFHHDLFYQGEQYYFEGRIAKNGENEVLKIVRDITSRKKAELINKISYNIALKSSGKELSIKEFCEYIQEQLGQLMDVSEFYLSQKDDANNLTFLHVSSSNFQGALPFTRIKGNGLSEYIIRTGKPLLLNGKQTLTFQQENGFEIYGTPAKCWIGAPLTFSGKTIGAITCQSYTNEDLYNKSHMELLDAVGNQIGLWLERKRTEKAIKVSEQKYRSLFQKMNEGFLISSPEGIIETVNPAFTKLLGYEEKEIIGKNGYELMVPKEFQKKLQKKLEKRKKGQADQYETQLIRKSGEVIWVNISASPYYNSNGNYAGVMSIFKNISEQKKSEENQASFINLFGNSLNEIYIFDSKDLNFKYTNKGAQKNLGYSFKELTQLTPLDLKNEFDENSFRKFIAPLALGKVPLLRFETVHQRKNGTSYPVEIHLQYSPYKGSDAFIAIVLDISERKKAERAKEEFTKQLEEKVKERTGELIESQKQLEEALVKEKQLGELKSRFVSTASHEFRTPMAIIQSNSELLSIISKQDEQGTNQRLERATSRIQNEIKRMTNLMDDILVLGKITSENSMNVNKTPIDLLAFCQDLVKDFNEIQKDERIIEVEFSGTPRKLTLDSKLISHALSNLLSNSLKYSKKDNPILHIFYEEENVKISISDKGIGIPKADLLNLFQPFHRANNVGDIQGSGLGLAIVKDYVERNNGTIDVISQLNKGSTFTISFSNN